MPDLCFKGGANRINQLHPVNTERKDAAKQMSKRYCIRKRRKYAIPKEDKDVLE